MENPQVKGSPGGGGDSLVAAKTAVRDRISTTRRRLSIAELGAAARDIAEHLLSWPDVHRAATVAAYASVGSEPGTGPLIDGLAAAGKRVLLPRLQPDNDLDWCVYTGILESAPRGLLEPSGPLLGRDAVATADVVIVPGMAVDAEGFRLGRGGGSYDRVLARVPAGTFTCVLLYDGEVGVTLPVGAHDRPVKAAATPRGITLLG